MFMYTNAISKITIESVDIGAVVLSSSYIPTVEINYRRTQYERECNDDAFDGYIIKHDILQGTLQVDLANKRNHHFISALFQGAKDLNGKPFTIKLKDRGDMEKVTTDDLKGHTVEVGLKRRLDDLKSSDTMIVNKILTPIYKPFIPYHVEETPIPHEKLIEWYNKFMELSKSGILTLEETRHFSELAEAVKVVTI